MIELNVANECGYVEAMVGITLSHGATLDRAEEIAPILAHKQGGHNKFLESIMVWLDVRAPRYWWAQADTYRMSTKQSESTMHTILKRELTMDDFAGIPSEWLERINESINERDLDGVKAMLPESFMQRRIWVMSYKTLQNIYAQRHDHKLKEWSEFCEAIVSTVNHPEFIVKK